MSKIVVGGVEKFSAVDFPGKLSAVVFMQVCPWKCPFCHNAVLVLSPDSCPSISEEKILDLKARLAQE